MRDRDYFFLWTFSAWGVLVALGLGTIWRGAAERLRAHGISVRRSWFLAAPVLALALVPLAGNAASASRAGQTFTREWALDLLNSVEPYGILVTNGDNDSFPLWYAQQVEGVRRDVTVALVPYLGMSWYARQLVKQPPLPYDSARGPAVYAAARHAVPRGALWALSDGELDTVPAYMELASPQRFRHWSIDATIPAGVLTRDQLLVLRAIKDSFPARPLYFASAGYPQSMGLGPYLRQQGLAYRLDASVPTADAATVSVDGVMLDVPRTRALWDTTYRGAAALVREGRWVDRASSQIPLHYALTGRALSTALAAQGDAAAAARVERTVLAIARTMGLVPAEGGSE